ncbi:hypothetical protein [Segetibacter koreensis]|uniref:hypothetical protein n=1 Tax=Segetibacter koreensis TaxID=398037 RepID=UPI000368740B|nr:hypothetical protein [Segetibacter koreensis]
MKKQLIKSIEKKVIIFSLAFVIIFGSYSNTFAAPERPASDAASYVSYKGFKGNYLVFKVDYKNEATQPFQLVIKNDHNEVLYSRSFDAKPLNTDVLLTEIPDDVKLTFSIETRKNRISQTFSIDSEVKTTQEYIVKGL